MIVSFDTDAQSRISHASGMIIGKEVRGRHQGVGYTLTQLKPDLWRWRFEIRDIEQSGTTETKLELLVVRRVRSLIDKELRS